jgi:hypothetical protein
MTADELRALTAAGPAVVMVAKDDMLRLLDEREAALDLIGVYARLRDAIQAAGSQQAFARSIGISPTYLSDVLNARREPGDAILRALGLRKQVRYVDARSSVARAECGA